LIIVLMSRVRPTSSRDKECLDAVHTCRVCLNPQTHSSPLLQLCLCRGSIRYQHAQCANSWL
jgi:E3 ubiquitin-protein ligase DOA10